MTSFRNDDSGTVAVLFAMSAMVLMMAVGLSVISSDINQVRSRVQDALDAAVLAATAAGYGTTDEERIALAQTVFVANFNYNDKQTTVVTVPQPTAVFSISETTVYGNTEVLRKSPFLSVFSADHITSPVSSAAHKQQGAPICVLGLNSTEDATMDFNGQAVLNIDNCASMTNSASGSGMHQVGQPSMKAKEIGVTGGYTGTGYDPKPAAGVAPVSDPLASLPAPTPGACNPQSGAKLQQATVTLTPGTYCGGLDIKAQSVVTLSPGIYIMKDGPLQINSGSIVTGNNVMIAFIGPSSTLYINGGASLSVTSPSSGLYANIQFFGDRTVYAGHSGNGVNGDNLWFTVIGDSGLTYDGVLYTPSMHAWFAGGSVVEAKSPNYIAIAKKLWFQDKTNVHMSQVNTRGLNVDGSVTLQRGATLFK